jgi:hypothetical protein
MEILFLLQKTKLKLLRLFNEVTAVYSDNSVGICDRPMKESDPICVTAFIKMNFNLPLPQKS